MKTLEYPLRTLMGRQYNNVKTTTEVKYKTYKNDTFTSFIC